MILLLEPAILPATGNNRYRPPGQAGLARENGRAGSGALAGRPAS